MTANFMGEKASKTQYTSISHF